MKILAIEKDLAPLPEKLRESLLREEAKAVWKLQQASLIREIYFHAGRPQAVLILECAGESEARQLLGSLPLAAGGFTGFETFPLSPYPGLARLFAEPRGPTAA